MTIFAKSFLSLLVTVIGGFVLIVIIVPLPGDTIETKEFTSGEIKPFRIGDSKEIILNKNGGQSFNPRPKPIECPKNWIDVRAMSETQKKCLTDSNEWGVGYGHKELCPDKTDHHISLHFTNNILSMIRARCTVAK